ncbi:MAG: DEAD/DEAH box helicase [Candidatus Hydrogenedentota bacterium]|nr:MAG: DEAD/DEAH box helicase [Candidatus Hydrogenedentota bacterium]GIX43893.1 MAG: DNA repair protein Rad25 [Candidatus Sumerlaea sp.]
MKAQLSYEQGDFFSVQFPYQLHYVRRIRNLGNRRWDPDTKSWLVHLAHLLEVMEIFELTRADIPPKLWRAYQVYRIRNYRVRLIAGPVMARLEGDNLPLDKIDAATSFFLPGYQYTQRFIEGRWDGRRHLLDRRRMQFPAGLLPRVRAVLNAEGVAYQFIEETPVPQRTLTFKRPPVELRDYQRACVQAALNARRGVLELATGAGKTLLAACLIHELGLPTLFVVHTRDLLHQTREVFRQHLSSKIGQVGDGKIDLQPVTVATVQTCSRAFGINVGLTPDDDEPLEDDPTEVAARSKDVVEFVRSCPVVFFDECHHLPAECCYALAMETKNAHYRYGLSATPYRADRLDMLLEAALGEKIFCARASNLIERGYLVPPEIYFYAVSPYRTAPSRRPDYATIFREYIIHNPERNAMIVEHARALAEEGKSVLVLVSQVAHGEVLRELMPEAPLVQGTDSAEKRQKVFHRLGKKSLRIVIATTLADEGLDIPTLDAVILASGGKSETRALQRVGRSLRPAPKKKHATIIDFFDNAPYLQEHSLRRLEIFRTEPAFRIHTVGFTA